MLLAYYVFMRHNSLKVFLSKEVLTVVVGVIMSSVFVRLTELLRMSQGPVSLLQLRHCTCNPVILCSVPACSRKTRSSGSECRCQGHSLAQDYFVASVAIMNF